METNEYELEPNPREIEVSNDDDVFLSVKIGNGQIGGNKVTLKGKQIAKGNLSEPTHIGAASSVKGATLMIETNVLDVNGFTNKCVITTSFTNQDNQVVYSKIDSGDAPENGVASFKGTYLLKVILMMLLSSSSFFSLAQNSEVAFDDLETPTSPGFILLDQTPASIEKPTTPQGLGLSLLGLQQNGGAISFAPYWLKDHPNVTAKNFRDTKSPISSHANVSLAYVDSDTSKTFALGLRTRLFQLLGGTISDKLDSIQDAITDELSNGAQIDLKKLEKLRKEYVSYLNKRVFTIDIAGAISTESLTGNFDDLEQNKAAAWISLNWRPKGNDFYVTLLNRYRNNQVADGSEDLYDLGGRLNYDISAFSVSMEYLNRWNLTTNDDGDYRIAAIGSYKISDKIYITSTFGKNFSDVNNIIALAGINFGYSKSKISAF